jgi:SAM-dependent methyltransferase
VDPCDLCGAPDPEPVLESPRLDGPLVRCRACGLVYVGRRRTNFTFAARDDARSQELAAQVEQLDLVRHDVEDAERPWRETADRDRLALLRRHVSGGTLLDVGCSTGSFLGVARDAFAASGVEPDPGTSEQARAAGLDVITGTLADVQAPPGGFDALTMFHVIEHTDSPRAELARARDLVRPGGVVLVETPTVDSLLFRLTRGRWRQLIPDHYFFFSRGTLETALRQAGFEPLDYAKVGRRASLRFVADRLRRSNVPLAGAVAAGVRAAHLENRAVRLNPGDIMAVVAEAR